jgi:hypothetical protein
MLREAGEQAKQGAYFDALSKIGMAAASYDKVATGGKVNRAPVVDRSYT